MAIIWADFPSGQRGLYGTTIAHMLNGIWAAIEGTFASSFTFIVNDPDPNIGAAGAVLQFHNDGATGVFSILTRFTMPSVQPTVGIAFRMWLSAFPIGDVSRGNPQWGYRTIANAAVCRLAVGASGQIRAYNPAGTFIAESGPNAVVVNAYNHVETKVLRDAAAGTIEVRVNGAVKLTLAAQALGATNIANLFVGQEGEASEANDRFVYYKDIVFWDGTGSYATDFQGSVAVHDLLTNADISLNWTPSSGATGWNLLDENPPNDADYISAADPPPAAAVFGLTNLPTDVTSIRALLPIMRAVKTDGGDCNIQSGLTPDNVAWVNGADVPVTVASTYYWSAIHTSPVTAAPWTPAEVNAAYVRVNRTL